MDGQRELWWFDGSTYRAEREDDPGSDRERLSRQLEAVRAVMRDGQWHTLGELAQTVGGSEAGCSARLRDFRKPRFGGWIVERRYVARGLHEYRMTGERDNDG
jgi:hypothetical protein